MNTHRSDFWLCATIAALTAIEFLQLSMTAFAAHPIMGELGLSPEDFSLIAAVYASVAVLMISMQRWLVEWIGGRRFICISTAVSAFGSILCATSHDYQSFLVGRIVMAVGGGALFTSARMIIQHLMSGPRRFVGIRALGTSLALGLAAGPWLASEAVSAGHWSAIYGLVACMGIGASVLAWWALPVMEPGRGSKPALLRMELQILLAVAVFALLYGLQRLYYDFFGDIGFAALIMAAAVLGLLGYAWHQHRARQPLLQVRRMLHMRYVAGMALFGFGYLMLGANNYVVPSMLLRTLGFAWQTVGQFEAIGLLAAVATILVVTRLVPRYPSPRKYLVVGFVSLTLFGVLLARLDTDADLWSHVLPATVLYSIFLLTVMPIAAMQSYRELADDERAFANAQQFKNMMAQVCITLGITLATVGQQWRTAVHYAVLNARVSQGDPRLTLVFDRLHDALSHVVGPVQATSLATGRIAHLLLQQSSMLANIDHFACIAILGVAGIAVTLVQRVFR
ncbi:MAG TPA: MFS transporter [Oleiagrimonas sp.]|nr:MFS transporter [Oleiagrimonas sp.]